MATGGQYGRFDAHAWAAVKIGEEATHAVSAMLGPGGHGCGKTAMAVQRAHTDYAHSIGEMLPDFERVTKDRVADERRIVVVWPPEGSWFPVDPEGANSSMWAAAVARHRVAWARCAWAWRSGGSHSWLHGPTDDFDHATVPAELEAAQAAADAAVSKLTPERATSAEEAVAQTRLRAADERLDAALAQRRRVALRAAEAAERRVMP